MKNQEIIEKLFKVQLAVKAKNGAAAGAIERTIIPLLTYEAPLSELSNNELTKIKGVGKQTASLITKIIEKAPLYELVASVAKRKKAKRRENF